MDIVQNYRETQRRLAAALSQSNHFLVSSVSFLRISRTGSEKKRRQKRGNFNVLFTCCGQPNENTISTNVWTEEIKANGMDKRTPIHNTDTAIKRG
jgi:hypothetical protein